MVDPLALLCLILAIVPPLAGRICGNISVRNEVKELESLRNCTVVEGNVLIVLIENQSIGWKDLEPYSFPELREVTEYLMFYRVRGLLSLGKLFPNLEKIGGSDLFQDFALVVYEMYSLQEIGLSSLREITRGSVMINKNPNLCFGNTVKWENITRWNAFMKNVSYVTQSQMDCPSCPDHCPQGACWNSTQCQFQTEVSHCHPLCVGGCSNPGPEHCYSCKGFYDPRGQCVIACPPNTYKYRNRRCVTREQCLELSVSGRGKVVHQDQCQDSCPSGLQPDYAAGECRPCEGRCPKVCAGEEISSTGEAQKFRGCTIIDGSLQIVIKAETSDAVHSILEESLGSIEQIKGHLQVARSSLTDLNFLKNLTVIHGSKNPKVASTIVRSLIIHDNENLQDLWDWTTKRNFTVVQGKVYFHYNPKLCLHRIYTLLDKIGYNKSVSSSELGKESNGDQFPCNADEISIAVLDVTVDSIKIRVPIMKGTDILRSVAYYTRDPHGNITRFDDLDQCSDYGWRSVDMQLVDKTGFEGSMIELEPYTIYAFYVMTYTMYSVGARSRIRHERTLPGTPTEITDLRTFVSTSSQIELRWQPPRQLNGRLQEYVVSWSELEEDRAFIDQRNYCEVPVLAETKPYKSRHTIQKPQNKSCCTNPQEILLPKDDFDILCNNFENSPYGFLDKTKYISCKSFFISYIHKSPFDSSTLITKETPVVYKTAHDEHFTSKKLGRNKNVSTLQNQISDIKQKDSAVKYENKSLLPSKSVINTKVVLKGLKHYQKYVISVKACREPHENETDFHKSQNNRCSQSEIITAQTKGIQELDAIPKNKVYVRNDDEKNATEISWDVPLNPNGYIVAFEIEYRSKDIENSNPMKDCLSYRQFEKNNNKHVIHSLSPGRYEFKVRAISLHGKGPTALAYYNLQYNKNSYNLIVILALVAVMVVALVILKVSPKNGVVVLDINPNYHYSRDEYEIDRDDVELVDELGTGSFGKVYRGRMKSTNLHCAIKTLSEDATRINVNEFLTEATVMKSMTKAYFLVEIYGVVSQGKPPLVLMELMDNGDLRTYLRETRETNPVTNAMMIKMALEIADGMAYMEAHKFVHRDLAARNCLVSGDLTVKVGDFGMSRDVYETEYYRKRNAGFLPIRWMAPESLKDGDFTSRSDVWSYGVVLWEIVTLAEQPYQGYSNDQVMHAVIAGSRLVIPETAPSPLAKLMSTCWRTKPSWRWTFMSIVDSLNYYHDDEFRRVAYYHSVEAVATRRATWEYVDMKPQVSAPPSYRLTPVDEESTNKTGSSGMSLDF